MSKTRYVTAFPGRRDSYQVPASLQQNGRLSAFLTSGYDKGPLAAVLKKLGSRKMETRHCHEISDTLVRESFLLEGAGALMARILAPSKASVLADDWLGRRAAAAANRDGDSLLVYEFQAEAAFPRLRSAGQRRILFHFHPHPDWEHPLLEADALRYPEFAPITRENTRAGMPPRYALHTRSAWRLADHVIVASSCTKSSLVQAGCPDDRISIVPYGCETLEKEAALEDAPEAARPFFLWVGSGSVRKGLHHVCEAWTKSGCSASADLIVIARVLDPGMERFLRRPGIIWKQGVPRAELNWHFRKALAFVMPSLSEGFGQVYLEALAKGCPVIGTRHSVLADLPSLPGMVTAVSPADIPQLAGTLREVLVHRPSDSQRSAAAAALRGFTWDNFKAGIENVLSRFD